MNITNKLKEIRIESGLSQVEFAQMCDVSRQTIHAVEVSKYTPSVELALKIAKNLGLTVEDIFKLKGKK